MKNVYGNLYFALEALDEIPNEIKEIYNKGIGLIDFEYTHNLVKVEKDRYSITLLNYPHLNTHAHPYLKDSLKIFLDLKNNFKKKKESIENPVILHRIELMLSKNNIRLTDLAGLTEIEEKKGLYDSEHIKFIGRRKYWNSLCRKLNLTKSISPEDNLISMQLDLFGNETSMINRGKTAMATKRPSAPTKILFDKGLIKNKVFDWGCGRGRDTTFLTEKGYNVISYDKYHKPSPSPSATNFSEINTILLNYVLNVIEYPNERTDLLEKMQKYGKKGSTILISVRSKKEIDKFAKKSNWKSFNDGFITSRNTFQKGFTINEVKDIIKDYIEVVEISDRLSYIYCIGRLKKNEIN